MSRSASQLDRDLADETVERDVVRVVWLGQSGFVLKSKSGQVVIDPYLSNSLTKKYESTNKPHVRMSAIPLFPDRLTQVDLLLISHKHSDHFDPETTPIILKTSPKARLVLPESLLDHALTMSISRERLVPLNAGDVFEYGNWTIRAIPSAHENLDIDNQGRHLYLGFIIEVKPRAAYFVAITRGTRWLTTVFENWLGAKPFDVLFLPINGRDPAAESPAI